MINYYKFFNLENCYSRPQEVSGLEHSYSTWHDDQAIRLPVFDSEVPNFVGFLYCNTAILH